MPIDTVPVSHVTCDPATNSHVFYNAQPGDFCRCGKSRWLRDESYVTDGRRHRPGDQPLPTPNMYPHCHDLANTALLRRYPTSGWAQSVCRDMATRKELGTTRYGTPLQAFNGRSFVRDLYEEIQDARAYGHGLLFQVDYPERRDVRPSLNWSERMDLVEFLMHMERMAMFLRRLLDEEEQR